MKRLILLRHGKSDWGADFQRDWERPLNPRGRRAAAHVGSFLAAIGSVPEIALTSTAVRAHSTVEIAAEAGRWGCPVDPTDELYEASAVSALTVIRRLSDDLGSALLAGHEPTLSRLLDGLIGSGDCKMVTAATARVDLRIDSWKDIAFGVGQLAWLVTPKLLERAGLTAVNRPARRPSA